MVSRKDAKSPRKMARVWVDHERLERHEKGIFERASRMSVTGHDGDRAFHKLTAKALSFLQKAYAIAGDGCKLLT